MIFHPILALTKMQLFDLASIATYFISRGHIWWYPPLKQTERSWFFTSLIISMIIGVNFNKKMFTVLNFEYKVYNTPYNHIQDLLLTSPAAFRVIFGATIYAKLQSNTCSGFHHFCLEYVKIIKMRETRQAYMLLCSVWS